MYSTCLFCHAPLGQNEELEIFPVGRRLAFDSAKGRLWVVCRKCERWNLTPTEERWEAVEACERRFRGTRLRVSTDNIGLARLPSGLELVRIGAALRPELAAWRYGDQLGRRRRRFIIGAAGVGVATAGVLIAGPVLGIFSVTAVSPVMNIVNAASSIYRQRRIVSVPREQGSPLAMRASRLKQVRIVPQFRSWSLRVTALEGATARWRRGEHVDVELTGAEALRASAVVLAHFNQRGGGQRQIRNALEFLDQVTSTDEAFRSAALQADQRHREKRRTGWFASDTIEDPKNGISRLPAPVRLALEIAANEESERRAMEGELALLEAAWRGAEEIAAIADDLLVSEKSRTFIAGSQK